MVLVKCATSLVTHMAKAIQVFKFHAIMPSWQSTSLALFVCFVISSLEVQLLQRSALPLTAA